MLLLSTILLTLALSSLENGALCAGDQVSFSHAMDPDPVGDILDDNFEAWLNETGYNWGMKGVAIAVTRKNEDGEGWTTETKGYGVANRWGDPVNEETLFLIGSNSKLFTALGVGLLTANESIPVNWNTKIKDIVPESLWNLQDQIARDHADFVDILSHRTGLPRHDQSYDQTDTPASATAKLRYLRPSTEFRETFQYNNQMYVLADHIISNLSGMPFTTYIERNIIAPAGLKSTTHNITNAIQSGNIAEGFVDTGRDEERGEGKQKIRFKPIPFWDAATGYMIAGAGGVLSNAKDLATWLQVLLLSGKSPETNETVIPSEIIDKVALGVTLIAAKPFAPELSSLVYGMGQWRYTYQGHDLIEHGGATLGHFSVVSRAPQDGVGIAVTINSQTDGPLLSLIKWKLLEKTLGLKTIDWEGRHINATKSKNSTQPHHSDGTSTTLPIDDLAGLYFNPGYGPITLCPYPSSNQPLRKECEGAISEALLPSLNDSTLSTPVLVAAWPKVWTTHMVLRHTSRDRFGVTSMIAFPAPFPDALKTDDNSRPFAIAADQASVEFVFSKDGGAPRVEGVACRDIWGPGEGVVGPTEGGREGAEVWFDRVA
ncbi:beta-lactamase/transpeptidase-like protein [Ramaria rubella]|nr:beta-lactamase/transpeptidase-like protein [Ramaria rubella]